MFFKILALAAFTIWLPSAATAELRISTDHRAVSFGRMELGQEKTLGNQGGFHNEITCSSTEGRSWYLKIHVTQPLSSGTETIPLEYFRWQVVSGDGAGTVPSGSAFRPFTLLPELVYVSGPSETSGEAVRLRLQYALTIPEAQVSGVYQTTIRLTLTEIL